MQQARIPDAELVLHIQDNASIQHGHKVSSWATSQRDSSHNFRQQAMREAAHHSMWSQADNSKRVLTGAAGSPGAQHERWLSIA